MSAEPRPYSVSQPYAPPPPSLYEDRHEMSAEEAHRRERGDFSNPSPNPLSQFLADFLKSIVNLGSAVRDNLYTQSPVIILTAGTALAINHYAPQYYPSLAGSSDPSFAGSVNVAKFVGLAFLTEAAVAPLFSRIEEIVERETDGRIRGKIHAKTIHYLNPLALTLIFAYKTGLNVKALHGTLYTVGIFALMKVLGKGYEYACKRYDRRERKEYHILESRRD